MSKRPFLISHLKTKLSPTSTSTSKCYNLYCPTNTSKVRTQVQPATQHEIQQAIHDSYEAQKYWSKDYTPSQRAQILLKASQCITTSDVSTTLSQLETNETGRPIKEIQSYDIPTTIEALNYYSYMPTILSSGSTYQHLDHNHSLAYTIHEPIGITVGIGAWNYPLVNAVMKSAPALIFGNSMIYKPSELTPSSALVLAEIYEDAGLPKGVFQVLLGSGEDVGKLLIHEYSSFLSSSSTCRHNNTHGKISFTGSVTTGHNILSNSSSSSSSSILHKVNLELGGKSPLIIMNNCNLNNAISKTIQANWYSNGQVCSNGTRVYVHESIYDEFISKLIVETEKLNIGNPNDMNVDIGPMISKEHMEKVLRYIDIGVNEDGATLVYGGERLYNGNDGDDGNVLSNGNFLSPAIFINCHDEMRIVKEEVFGMLMSVLKFSDEEEVLQRANASHFGLAAGIITNDLKQAHRMASKLKAGTVWINNYNMSHVSMPWGAVKKSGIGCENGNAALEAWTTEKVIFIDME